MRLAAYGSAVRSDSLPTSRDAHAGRSSHRNQCCQPGAPIVPRDPTWSRGRGEGGRSLSPTRPPHIVSSNLGHAWPKCELSVARTPPAELSLCLVRRGLRKLWAIKMSGPVRVPQGSQQRAVSPPSPEPGLLRQATLCTGQPPC